MGTKYTREMTCRRCGSNDIVKHENLYMCRYCRTKFSVDATKKIQTEGYVKVDGPIEIKDSMTLEKMLKNGETFVRLGKLDEALKVFTEAADLFPEDYRGWWEKACVLYSLYYKKFNAKETRKIIHAGEHPDWRYVRTADELISIAEARRTAEELNYIVDSRFVDALRSALIVAPDDNDDIIDKVVFPGTRKLNEYRKSVCQLIINDLCLYEGQVKHAIERDQKKKRRDLAKLLFLLISGLILVAGAVFFAICSLVYPVYEGLILTALLLFPGIPMLRKARSMRSSYLSSKRYCRRNSMQEIACAEAIEYHNIKLKEMEMPTAR